MKPNPVLRTLLMNLIVSWAMVLWTVAAGGAGLEGFPTRTFHNPNPAPQMDARFGKSVAISDDLVAISSAESTTGGATGVVRVFSRSSGVLLHKLNLVGATDFGSSIAFWGSRLLVGVPRSEESFYGGILIYDMDSANPEIPVQKIINTRKKGVMGRAMAVSGDRLLAGIVSAGVPEPVPEDGAHVYALSAAKAPKLTLVIKVPPASAGFAFGQSVALSGNRAVIGDMQSYVDGVAFVGRVYVYNLASSTPGTPMLLLKSPAPVGRGQFGESLAFSGSKLVIGAPGESGGKGSAYFVDLSKSAPVPVPISPGSGSDWAAFGSQVVISGEKLCISALPSLMGGKCFIYDFASGPSSAPVSTIPNPQPRNGDSFGAAVVMAGAHLLIGAPDSHAMVSGGGLAHLHDLAGPMPATPVHSFFEKGASSGDGFGNRISVTSSHLVVGAPYAERVYVFDRSLSENAAPAYELMDPVPVPRNRFGSVVAADGRIVVVGAPNARANANLGTLQTGAVSVFDLSLPDPQAGAISLINPNPGTFTYFGSSVCVSGSVIAVGAYDAPFGSGTSRRGMVFIYDLSSATPSNRIREIWNPVASTDDMFGYAVALRGSRLVVSGPGAYDGTGSSGAVYVFDLSGAAPGTPTHTLLHPDPTASSLVGRSIAIEGDKVGVSVSTSTGVGEAIVYDVPPGLASVTSEVLRDPFLVYPVDGASGYRPRIAMEGTQVFLSYGSHPFFSLFDLASTNPHRLKVTAGKDAIWIHATTAASVQIKDGLLFSADPTLASTSLQRGAVHEITLPSRLPPIIIVPPVVTLAVGADLHLDATASFQPGDPLVSQMRSYQWDIDGDGDFVDATGAAPVVPWKELAPSYSYNFNSNSTYRMGVKVTAPDGLTAVSSFLFRLSNIRITSPASGRIYREPSGLVTITGEPEEDAHSYSINLYRNEVLVGTTRPTVGPSGGPPLVWSKEVQLLPGMNTIVAKSTASSVSSAPVHLFYEVKRPVPITSTTPAQGSVVVSPAPGAGGKLILGRAYSITAKPKPGYLFDGWMGASTSSEPTITLSFAEGDALQARFVASPFVESLPGTYIGVLEGSSPSTRTQEHSGRIDVSLSGPSGALTGKIVLDGLALPLAGKVDHRDFRFDTPIPNTGFSVSLLLDTGGMTPRFSGQVTRWRNGIAVAQMLVGANQAHSPLHPLPQPLAGTFNLGFRTPASSGGLTGADIPHGRGFAILKVSKVTGSASIVSTLADGKVCTFSSRVCRDGSLPLYAGFAAQSGALVGLAKFDTTSARHDLSATDIRWHSRPSPAAAYPFGFGAEGLAMGMEGARQSGSTVAALQLGDMPLMGFSGPPLLGPVSTVLRRSGLVYESDDKSTRVSFTATGQATGRTTLFSPTGVSEIKGLIVGKNGSAAFHAYTLELSSTILGSGRSSGLADLYAP